MNRIIDIVLNEKIPSDNDISQLEELSKDNNYLTIDDIDILLTYLAYIVRKKIADSAGESIQEYSYTNKCDLAQSMICYYLNEIGINTNPININEIINGVIGHSFVIAKFNTENGEKTYLIDPTYIQFFSKDNCLNNKYTIIDDKVIISPDPGYFVLKDNHLNEIKPLLEKGYIELTEEVAKIYGDSFFQTKQGTTINQIKNNVASGSIYMKWFNNFTSSLSKTKEGLENMDLLIKDANSEKKVIR